MNLTVFSHKLCWPSADSPSGYATDGGFAMQMRALSQLFDETILVVPVTPTPASTGEVLLTGDALKIAPLSNPSGVKWRRKLNMIPWLLVNGIRILREVWRADAVHVPIPGDVGTIGMLAAWILRKPLFVRYCGNWFIAETLAEKCWKWFMETVAGGRNVMLATGGDAAPPSARNPAVHWIFSTSLTQRELMIANQARTLPDASRARLVIACRQERAKGTGLVIESLPALLRDFPGLTLDVIGDGGALDEFKQLANHLGVASQVNFHGKVNHDNVMRLMRQADLFCYPTVSSEGFPKVVLEALACGMPVITTKVSILPLLIGNQSGVLLETADVETLTQAIRDCLHHPARYSDMSGQAIITARQYSLERWRDTIGEQLEAAWGQKIGRKLNA